MFDSNRIRQLTSGNKNPRNRRKDCTTPKRRAASNLLRVEWLEDRRLLSGSTMTLATTTTLEAYPPTSQYGQPVVLVADVTTSPKSPRGSGPTGTVEFWLGTPPASTTPAAPGTTGLLGSANVTQRGAAILDSESSPLPVGSGETITAEYYGSSSFSSSQGTATVTVNPAATHTVIYASPNPGVVGASVTFTAIVSGAALHWANNGGTITPPAGTVNFTVEGGVPASATFVGDSGSSAIYTYTTSFSTAGSNSVSATFTPAAPAAPATEANYEASSSQTLNYQIVSAANAGTGTITAAGSTTGSSASLKSGQTFTINFSSTSTTNMVTYVDSANGINLAGRIASVVFSSNGDEAEISGTGTNTDGSTTTPVNFTLFVNTDAGWSGKSVVSISIVGNTTVTAGTGFEYSKSGVLASGSTVTISETGSTATIPPGGGLPGAHDRVLQSWPGDDGGSGGGRFAGRGFGGSSFGHHGRRR
ncbi:MAG: Ig-like domain repeat protein [Thermoguttaceae bacterium]